MRSMNGVTQGFHIDKGKHSDWYQVYAYHCVLDGAPLSFDDCMGRDHLEINIRVLAGFDRDRFHHLLDARELLVDEGVRESQILQILETRIGPSLERLCNAQAVIDTIKGETPGRLHDVMVTRRGWELVGVDIDSKT